MNHLKSGCVKIKIREGAIQKVYDWRDHLNDHRAEALESLRQEGVFIESVFLDTIGDENYLVYYMKFRDPEKAKNAFLNSTLNIDRYHEQFKKEVWTERKELELLVDFVNEDMI
jgi:hypothetical protein